jgi:hypothetical protein
MMAPTGGVISTWLNPARNWPRISSPATSLVVNHTTDNAETSAEGIRRRLLPREPWDEETPVG